MAKNDIYEQLPVEVGGSFIHSSEFTEDQIRAICKVKVIKLRKNNIT
jgi:hypothetical protein